MYQFKHIFKHLLINNSIVIEYHLLWLTPFYKPRLNQYINKI